jgi:hypothetical protein
MSTTGEVAICNSALILLGAATIIDINQDDPKAVALNVKFPLVRDAELRRRRWRFSLRRASLPALSAAPAFGFPYQYALPTEPPSLRIIQVGAWHAGDGLTDFQGASDAPYSIEGGNILTHYGAPLQVRYIGQITDTSLYDPAFAEAFAARLAYECCYKITQSTELMDRCLRHYKMSISEAKLANALENAPEHFADDTWITARR